jgi:hypothetical protein
MNKKGVSSLLLVGIIVAIIIIGVVAYWAYTNYGTATPTPTPTPTPTSTPSPVTTATSLGFKVNATIGGTNELYAFTAKNLGTSNILLRVDQVDAQGNAFVYLFNQTGKTVWASISGQWTDISDQFDSYWSGANSQVIGYTAFNTYKTELAQNWSGTGTYDYTSGGDSFHIYDIIVNPGPADSIFVHG